MVTKTFTDAGLDFDADLASLGLELERDIEETVVRRLALGIFTAVQKWSPVSEGRFRSAWAVDFDMPSGSTAKSPNPAPKGEVDVRAEQRAVSKIQGFSLDRNRDINITNNLPYSRRLATGYSTQAPDGSLDLVIRTEVEKIK